MFKLLCLVSSETENEMHYRIFLSRRLKRTYERVLSEPDSGQWKIVVIVDDFMSLREGRFFMRKLFTFQRHLFYQVDAFCSLIMEMARPKHRVYNKVQLDRIGRLRIDRPRINYS